MDSLVLPELTREQIWALVEEHRSELTHAK